MASTQSSSPSIQINNKLFSLVACVEKLPYQIECLTSFGNTFILGLNSGQIIIYSIQYSEQELKLKINVEKSIKSITKKPIQQLEAIPKYSLLLALFESQIHVFDLTSYQHKYTIQKSKGALQFATNIHTDRKILSLAVVCKKKIQFFYLNLNAAPQSQFMELMNDLELNDTPKTLQFTSENIICFSQRKDYYKFELPLLSKTTQSQSQSQPQQQQPLKEVFSAGNRSLEPLCYKMCDSNIALCIEENKTIILDSRMQPAFSYALTWTSSPASLCQIGPFMLGLLPSTNSIELITMSPKCISAQLIDFGGGANSSATLTPNASSSSLLSSTPSSFLQSAVVGPALQTVASVTNNTFGLSTSSSSASSSDKLKLLSTNGNSICYIATQSNVWCLVPMELSEQMENLLLARNFSLATNLIETYSRFQSTNPQIDAEEKTTKDGSTVVTRLSPFFNCNLFKKEINKDLIAKISNMEAFELYRQKKFDESMKHFEKLQTDPSYIIAFIPGLLPDTRRAQLINSKELKLPELSSQETEKAIESLIDYLQFKRKEFLKIESSSQNSKNGVAKAELYSLIENKVVNANRKQILEIIDTTLLQCYLKIRELLVQNFLRLDKNYCHLETSERLLKTHKKLNELVILYEKKGLHEKALALLLGESGKSDSVLFGYLPIIKYLRKLGNANLELILKYAKIVLEKNAPLVALQIFIDTEQLDSLEKSCSDFDESDDVLFGVSAAGERVIGGSGGAGVEGSNNDDLDDSEGDETLRSLDRVRIAEFLRSQIEPSELSVDLLYYYLEYCIFKWRDTSETLNNLLIHIYKVKLSEKNEMKRLKMLKRKLLRFLSETSNYDVNNALSQFEMDSEERAILLGKLGKHIDALRIYVEVLNDTRKAELYCKHVYSNPTFRDSKNVYYHLLNMYLNSDNYDTRVNGSTRLLNLHSNEIASCKTLEMLPSDMNCKNISSFIQTMLSRVVRSKHNHQIIKNLLFSLNLQIQELKIVQQQTKFVVTEEKMCIKCNKRIGRSAIVRYPNGTIIHYGCCKDSNLFDFN